jgi:hypothetical protein
MAQAKITAKIFGPLLKDFDGRLRELHLKRDAFVDHVVSAELAHLEKDLQGKSLTPRARQHIARKLKRMGTIQVNLVIDAATADKLRAIVEQSNIVRDAFINRLIYFLRGSDKLLHHLELPHIAEGLMSDRLISPILVSPLNAIAAVHADPLAVLRHEVNNQFGIGLYLLKLPDELSAFACYLDESDLPAVSKSTGVRAELSEQSNELEALEESAYKTPSRHGKASEK